MTDQKPMSLAKIMRPLGLLLVRLCDACGVLLFGLAGWIEFEKERRP